MTTGTVGAVETAIRTGGAASRPGFHAPALDGLRGVAVLGVVAFHLAALEHGDRRGLLGGGWLGVDVFFTLSGYLITSLLLAELDRGGRVDLRAFWRRRIRRLQPAALVAIAAIVVTAPWWAPAGTASSVKGEALSALSGIANWHSLWTHRPYAAGTNPSAFEHFWSLSVEEQFYVVWPLALTGVALLWRRRGRTDLHRPVLAVSVAGIAVSWWVLAHDALQRGYLGTDARAASILLGAALAAVLPMRRYDVSDFGVRVGGALLWTGIVVSGVLWCAAGWPPHAPLAAVLSAQGLATVAALAGVMLAPSSRPALALSTKPLVQLGRVSYGVYLWHWPVFVILTPSRLGTGWALTTIIRLTVLTVLVAASWFVVEHPIRRGVRFPRTRVAYPVAIVTVIAVAIVAVRAVDPTPAWARADGSLIKSHHDVAAASVSDGVIVHPSRVLVVGDSIATSLVSGPTDTLQMATGHLLDDLADRGIAASAATITGCPVIAVVIVAERVPNDTCIAHQDRWLSPAMVRVRPDLVVWYSRQEAYPFVDRDGHVTTSTDELAALYAARLRWFRDQGARVLLVSPGPNADGWEWNSPDRHPEVMARLDTTIDRVARENPDAVAGVVHMRDLLCDGAPAGCPDLMPGGGHYRIDGVHFLGPGADAAASWLADRIAAVNLR